MQNKELWWARRDGEIKHDDDGRDEYYRDYSRVVHSAALRRLQAKTQVLGLGESDFYRTRLTHSLEVSQIGVGILTELKRKYSEQDFIDFLPDERLLEAICLSHDYGHPPFGHGGERALNFAMKDHGGFEGNGQTLRILSKLEKYSLENGLNPTRRMLLGILKYPAKYTETVVKKFERGDDISVYKDSDLKPPKCYYDCDADVVSWIIEPFSGDDRARFIELDGSKKTLYKSLDCNIMDLADEISYSVHDLEDSIKLKLIDRGTWKKYINIEDLSRDAQNDIKKWEERIFSESENEAKRGISNMVYYFVHAVEKYELDVFEHPILRFRVRLNDEAQRIREMIQDLVWNEVVKSHKVRILENKGQKIVYDIFREMMRDPKSFLPPSTYAKYDFADDQLKPRIICDYVSGMTDEYASRLYQRLFLPKFGSLFDI